MRARARARAAAAAADDRVRVTSRRIAATRRRARLFSACAEVQYAMTAIPGIGRRISTIVLKKAEVDLNKRAGEWRWCGPRPRPDAQPRRGARVRGARARAAAPLHRRPHAPSPRAPFAPAPPRHSQAS